MKTFLVGFLCVVGLLVSTAQAQLYRVPGAPSLEQRPYQPLHPSPVPPVTLPPLVVRPAPHLGDYLPRQQQCFATVHPTPAGAVVRTTCY